jgi:hypothetical protein
MQQFINYFYFKKIHVYEASKLDCIVKTVSVFSLAISFMVFLIYS